jgi:4-amino-4-deoxy-L-arabinose transferase-like glycosyltransferase
MELCDDVPRGLVKPRGLDLRHSLLLVAVAFTAVRWVAASAIHLTEDEAYYRLWAQHLQFGYYDHPPMIAWWIRVGEAIAGDTALGVRLLPVLAAGLTTWLVGDLALRLGADRPTAARAALWYNATLTIGMGGILAVPDAPASLFWVSTLWCLARGSQSGRARWWIAAGASAGLAALSKYSGLFIAPGVLLWLAMTPGGRRELRRPWPWAAVLVAGLLLSTNVLWNAQNHWVTIAKQFGRMSPGGLHPGHLAEFLLTQLVLLNPLVAIFAVAGIGLAWRWRRTDEGPRLMLLAATSAPFAAYLLLHSLHDRVQGHWPVPLFGALAICAAVAAGQATSRAGRLARWAAPVLGLSISLLGLADMALPTLNAFSTSDPALALRGWPAFAADVEQLRRAEGAAWVGTQSYGLLAQLELEHGIQAPLLQVVERDRYRADAMPRPDFSRPGLIVDLQRRMVRVDVLRCFTDVRSVGAIERGYRKGPVARYAAFLVSGPRRDVWTQGCPDQIRPGVWR